MQMPLLAFAKLSLGSPILITSTTTQLVLNIYFINPQKKQFGQTDNLSINSLQVTYFIN